MLSSPEEQKRRSPIEVISEWWRACSSNAVAVSEFMCHAEGEVERLAKEMGLSSAELQQLSRLDPDAAALVIHRMAALGVDQKEVSHAVPKILQELKSICTMCENRKLCARDLELHPTDKVWEDYCPNAVTLKVLMSMRGVPRHKW